MAVAVQQQPFKSVANLSDMKTNNLIPASLQTQVLDCLSRTASAEFDKLRKVSGGLNMLDVDHVPAEFLPFLAWQFRVEVWDTKWPTEVKRKVVKTALAVHRTKGTVHAVELALAAVGVKAEIVEWWQSETQQEPGTFDIVAYTNRNITPSEDSLINRRLIEQLEALIRGAKRHSQHFTVSVGVEVNQTVSTAMAGRADNLTAKPGALIPRQPLINGGANIGVSGMVDHLSAVQCQLVRRHPQSKVELCLGLVAKTIQEVNISGRLIRRVSTNTNV
ncbi:phage tail protein I [Pseudoalteromonas sp. Of7M-16]|uniref:phage tail protein I n=1 Tax=Pseudoalteromonas sp. Of7M-16 TaxID=2917756 RepID=UPI001EF5FA3B|nr:phage tail protein I [Pseudoalteromonas sp. Of7M-16]MCG7550416.1 phage tail protein I [Pseudoalteromonas sp. Of7M-16]